MVLPTGTTIAVADGDTVPLSHNTGVNAGVHLVEITAASDARHHTGSADPMAGGSSRTTSRQRRPRS